MSKAQSTIQIHQPVQLTGLMTNLEDRLRRIVGASGSNNAVHTSRLNPSTYLEACCTASNRVSTDDKDAYFTFLDLIHRIRSAVNAFASRLRAAACERIYLTALIDIMAMRPSAVLRGNYRVRFSAREAEEFISLSASSCTAARRGLVEKGLIAIDGDQIDLSPFIETLQPFLAPATGTHQVTEKTVSLSKKSEALPENRSHSNTLISNVPLKKETVRIGEADDLFSREAIKETIALSPKLQKAIGDMLGCDYREAQNDEIMKVLEPVTRDILYDGPDFCYARAWKYGLKHHGIRTLTALVATLEGREKNHPGKWFWSLINRKKLDVTSNIRSLVVARENAQLAEEAAVTAAVERQKRDAIANRQAELSKIALSAIDDLKASGELPASEYFWMTAANQFQIKVDDNVVRLAIRPTTHKTERSTLETIARLVAERFGSLKTIYDFGSFAGIPSVSSFR